MNRLIHIWHKLNWWGMDVVFLPIFQFDVLLKTFFAIPSYLYFAGRKLFLQPPKRWAEGWGRKQTLRLLKRERLGLRVNPPLSQGAGRALPSKYRVRRGGGRRNRRDLTLENCAGSGVHPRAADATRSFITVFQRDSNRIGSLENLDLRGVLAVVENLFARPVWPPNCGNKRKGETAKLRRHSRSRHLSEPSCRRAWSWNYIHWRMLKGPVRARWNCESSAHHIAWTWHYYDW